MVFKMWPAPTNWTSIPSAFEKAIADAGESYVRIPPGAKNHQSDVERANGLIKYELLEIERWQKVNLLDLLRHGNIILIV